MRSVMGSADANAVTDQRRREYRFGEFRLDLDEGVLYRSTEEIALRPKTFALLAYLIGCHGRLVIKTELIDAGWSDAAVTESSLSQCLLEIRRALKDDGQQVIRTRSRRGYIFAAPVTATKLSFVRAPDL